MCTCVVVVVVVYDFRVQSSNNLSVQGIGMHLNGALLSLLMTS